jgi:hypothetical protein
MGRIGASRFRPCAGLLVGTVWGTLACAKVPDAADALVLEEAAPSLVRVGALPTANILPLLSVWVTTREIRVVRGVEQSVPSDRVEARASPHDARDHMLAPIHDGIARIVAESSEDDRYVFYYNNGAARVEHAARLVVGGDVLISTLVDVVYSAGRAGLSGYAFALEGPEGPGAIEIVHPQLRDPSAAADGPKCVLPRFVFATTGTYVDARLVEVSSGWEVESEDAPWAEQDPDG